ncbi:MAG: LacI family transcriptional regulator, partial [Armatimonadota bacterium]|nr:LacI family transcriptional regulator [Armatimonadota bacterium]
MRKRTTSEDIARLTGVSRATVSYVINGRQETRISPETRDRILKAAKENGYQRNRLAAALSTGRTHTVGVVTHPNGFRDGRNTYCQDMFLEISLAAARAKQNALMFLEPLVTEADGVAAPGLRPNDLSDGRVDGVIVFGHYDRPDWVRQASNSGLPFVEVGSQFGHVSVLADNAGGIRQALEHLWALGHRRIAFFTHQQNVPSNTIRTASFRAALREWGADAQDCPLLHAETDDLRAALDGSRRPTA